MTSIAVSSNSVSLTFGKSPFQISRLRNRDLRRNLGGGLEQSLLVRTPLRISDPVFLNEPEVFERMGGGVRILVTDERREYHAELSVSADEDGLIFGLKVTGPVPLWMVEWKLAGLDLDEVIVPALGGQSLSKSMPPDTTLSYKYPFWWNAQFAIGTVRGGGLWLRTQDSGPRFKLLRVRKEGDRFALTLGFEADGPLTATSLEARWRLDCYKGSWKVPVDRHRDWMEEAFSLVPLEDDPFNPPWARDINFILEIWGMAKDRPAPLHTFSDMKARLREFGRLHDPTKTLVYLPGYAEHGIDSRAPSYEPSRYLGGEEAFREFVDFAHSAGYRVMIHTNVLCMTFDHPLHDAFGQHQVVDLFGRPQGWGLDIDGDWLAEPYFAYINPGAKAWGDLMVQVLGSLIQRFSLDAVFLDQTLLAFNVGRGPNFLTGMRDHIRRLQRAFPGVLFAGEGFHEIVAGTLPMAQIHGIDSIAEVHGMEGGGRWRRAHPVSAYLFGKYTKFTAHLLTRHPSHPLLAAQEEAYARLGVVPALCLYNSAQPTDLPAVRRMVRRARSL